MVDAARRERQPRQAQSPQGSGATVSFRADWAAFGKLAARLVDADWTRVEDLTIPAFEVADHLFAVEVRLLRNLSGIELLDRLDGDVVLKQIDQVIATVSADAAGKDMKLQLVLDLRADSPIGRLIAAHRGTDTKSIAPELPAIVEADLSDRPLLVGVIEEGDDALKLMLRGHDYWYRLRQLGLHSECRSIDRRAEKKAKKNLRRRTHVPATLSLKRDLTRSRSVVLREGCEPCLSGRAGMLGRLCAGPPVPRMLEVSSRRRRKRTGKGTRFANLRQKE